MFQSLIGLSAATTWTFGKFLENLKTNMETWAGFAIVIIGIVLVAIAVFKIAKGLASHGKGDVNWVMCIIMLIFGAFLLAAGSGGVLAKLTAVGKGGVDTITGIGGGTIVLDHILYQVMHIFG